MRYSVGDVARLAHVTVRTLHHYDVIGLLRPSARTDAGYRRYSDDDLNRLRRVLIYRELGFDLERIAAIVDGNEGDESDPLAELRRQRDLLSGRIDRLQGMLVAVNKLMEARKMGINLDPAEMLEVFGESDPTQYAEEAEERWGNTDAYAESRRRTAQYTRADWLRLQAEANETQRRFADVHAAGRPATSTEAMDVAEAHRLQISRWFYPCDYSMHRGLGDMYLADPRFTATYERVATGLAGYVRDAIHANADRQAGQ